MILLHTISNLKMTQGNLDYVLSDVNMFEMKLYIFKIIEY
jgi:hypothetical protein